MACKYPAPSGRLLVPGSPTGSPHRLPPTLWPGSELGTHHLPTYRTGARVGVQAWEGRPASLRMVGVWDAPLT